MSASRLLSQETIRQIAEAILIEEVIGADLPLKRAGTVFVGLCPFHQEKTPSLTITSARQRYRCFGCGAHGDVFGYVMAREGIGFPEAARTLASRAGIHLEGTDAPTNVSVCKPCPRPYAMQELEKVLRLPQNLRVPTRAELQALAEQRGLSIAGLQLATTRGLLWWGTPRNLPAWIVTDHQRINAQARRMDGRLWEHIGNKKTWTLFGSQAAWPLGTREAVDKPCVALTEGGPDWLAAHGFIAAKGRENDVAAITVLGASNHLPTQALELLTGKRVRLFPHLDKAGQDEALRWTRQLEQVGCEVDAFSFDGLQRSDGKSVNDLNDLALIDADAYEAERHNLEGVLP